MFVNDPTAFDRKIILEDLVCTKLGDDESNPFSLEGFYSELHFFRDGQIGKICSLIKCCEMI